MKAKSKNAVIVLAAGAGHRMGEPKALMEVRGQPWWVLQQERLNEIAVDQVWVFSPHVRRVVQSSPNSPAVMAESESCKPMFASVAAGVNRIDPGQYAGVFVLPIDVPVPKPVTWRALSDTARCAVPVYQGTRGHPVYLPDPWIESHLRPVAMSPDARLDVLVHEHLTEVEVDDPEITWNLNTPEELTRWLESKNDPR